MSNRSRYSWFDDSAVVQRDQVLAACLASVRRASTVAVAERITQLDPERKLDSATILSAATELSATELATYLGDGLTDHPLGPVRWSYRVEQGRDSVKPTVRRVLISGEEELDIQAMAEDLISAVRSGDHELCEKLLELYTNWQHKLPPRLSGAMDLWHREMRWYTEALQPIVDQLVTDGQDLINRWTNQPPCIGFDAEDPWSIASLTAVGEHRDSLNLRDIQLYLAEGLLRFRPPANDPADEIAHWALMAYPQEDGTGLGIQPFILYPPIDNIINLAASVDQLSHPVGVNYLHHLITEGREVFPQ